MSRVCHYWSDIFSSASLWRERSYRFAGVYTNIKLGEKAVAFAKRHSNHLKVHTVLPDYTDETITVGRQIYFDSQQTHVLQESLSVGCVLPATNRMCFGSHQMSVPVESGSYWGPQVNNFEQISSKGHNMSLAGGQGRGVPHLMSREGGGRVRLGGGVPVQ